MWFGQGNYVDWDDNDRKMLEMVASVIDKRLLWPKNGYINGLEHQHWWCQNFSKLAQHKLFYHIILQNIQH